MENKPYKISKEDAIILQQYCMEIKPILEKYAWRDLNDPNFVTTMSRIKSAFSTFQEWVGIAYSLAVSNNEN
jgi:hypothetical protein